MRLLVIRSSAMGDVALTAPVLTAMRKQYPDIELVLLTRKTYQPFFSSVKGLHYFFPDLKHRHKGFPGLVRLFNDIDRQFEIDYVIDLHDVLRSKILRFFFRLTGVCVAVIDKGRNEKRLLLSGKRKMPLKHSAERYCDVFAKAGFPVTPNEGQSIFPSQEPITKAGLMIAGESELNIGVAPYAKHKLKMWPEDYMIRLLGLINQKHKSRFWFFGGQEESKQLSSLQLKVPGSFNLSGKLTLDEELAMMSRLDMMISMDSSNMHMAALVGTKVISIWGGTDPMNGFGAWMQPAAFSVSIPVDELICRPCTIYGKGDCRRGDFACMNWLTPEIVFQKIDNLKLL